MHVQYVLYYSMIDDVYQLFASFFRFVLPTSASWILREVISQHWGRQETLRLGSFNPCLSFQEYQYFCPKRR